MDSVELQETTESILKWYVIEIWFTFKNYVRKHVKKKIYQRTCKQETYKETDFRP